MSKDLSLRNCGCWVSEIVLKRDISKAHDLTVAPKDGNGVLRMSSGFPPAALECLEKPWRFIINLRQLYNAYTMPTHKSKENKKGLA
jgi:hypothetical protein